MQRNKLIYALADAALVINSDYEKGGTWAGAVEQLEKLRLAPVYARSHGETGKGLEALRRKGALPWPNPETPEALAELLVIERSPRKAAPRQNELFSSVREESKQVSAIPQSLLPINASGFPLSVESPLAPADELFAKVRELVGKVQTPRTVDEVTTDLGVLKSQAKKWLQRLVEDGEIEECTRKPVRYRPKTQHALKGGFAL